MEFVQSFDINKGGLQVKQIPCITGKGAPTTATEGAVGLFYMDEDSGEVYKCTAAADGVYTWEIMGGAEARTDTVLYTEQTLTEVQKAQARENVGISGNDTIRNAELSELWAAVLALSGTGENYPELKSGRSEWYKSAVDKKTITEVHIVPSYEPNGSEDAWNGDTNNSGAIKVYRNGTVVTISAEGKGKIRLPADSAYLFQYFEAMTTIDGLEYVDASNVVQGKLMFYGCRSLVRLDLSSWKMLNVQDIRQFCCECNALKSFRFSQYGTPNVLKTTNSSGNIVGATRQMFANCYKLKTVDMGRSLSIIGSETFLHCFELETVVGLGSISDIEERAFLYTPCLRDVDVVPMNINAIGESAFRWSSIEDALDLSVVPAENIGNMATRNKRWGADTLQAIHKVEMPSVYFDVPNLDNQKKYKNVAFGKKEDGTVITISDSGCSALALYHAWNALYAGTPNEYPDFLSWWNEKVVPTGFVENNTWSKGDELNTLITSVGWTTDALYSVDDETPLQNAVKRLSEGYPVFASINSANSEDGTHAVLIVGCDKNTHKLAIVDSSAKNTGGEEGIVSWIAYEDLFSETFAKDYIRLIAFGDADPIVTKGLN